MGFPLIFRVTNKNTHTHHSNFSCFTVPNNCFDSIFFSISNDHIIDLIPLSILLIIVLESLLECFVSRLILLLNNGIQTKAQQKIGKKIKLATGYTMKFNNSDEKALPKFILKNELK